MIVALLITALFILFVWLVFFQFKLIKFSIGWGVVSSLFFVHLLLIFVIGIRFLAPYSTDVRVIQHTIQIIPRLPEPTLVTAVLVEPNVPVKKGQPLFEFDRRLYEDKVREQASALASAKQNVLILKANLQITEQAMAKAVSARDGAKVQSDVLQVDVNVAQNTLVQAQSARDFARVQRDRFGRLVKEDAARGEQLQQWEHELTGKEASVAEARDRIEKARLQAKQWQYELRGAEAAVAEARDTVTKARLAYDAQIGGINPAVAEIEAKLAQARYYLDQTTIYAPEDGYIINLQVRPGMVAGIVRIGAIAAFIVEADRYVLDTFYQEHLKFVKAGQPVEVALNLYPGRILKGKVDSIWLASGEGQLLPSGELPTFTLPPKPGQVGYAVKIVLDGNIKVPIGAQGAAAIYTTGGGFAALRRVVIRTYSWLNWLYPIPF